MKKYQLIKQHYDMTPGTVVWKVATSVDLYTVDKDVLDRNLRIIPADKLQEL